MKFSYVFPLFVVIAQFTPSQKSMGESVDDFKIKYSAAAAKLETAYSTGTINATVYNAPVDNITWKDSVILKRNGNSSRSVDHTIESTDPKWPVGSIAIMGRDGELFYQCLKPVAAKDFSFGWFGPSPRIEEMMPYKCLPYFCPTYIGSTKLIEQIAAGVKINVQASRFDETDVTEVDVEFATGKAPDQYFLSPVTYAIRGWIQKVGRSTLKGVVKYLPLKDEFPPRVNYIKTWQEGPGDKISHTVEWQVLSIDFKTVEKKEFAPAALAQLGVKDIPSYDNSNDGSLGTTPNSSNKSENNGVNNDNVNDLQARQDTTTPQSTSAPEMKSENIAPLSSGPSMVQRREEKSSSNLSLWISIPAFFVCGLAALILYKKSKTS